MLCLGLRAWLTAATVLTLYLSLVLLQYLEANDPA